MKNIGERQNLRICICEDRKEDSEQLYELLSLLSEEYPMQLEFFNSAEQLLLRLKKEAKESYPNIILLDIELPGMDGITLGKQIKQMDEEIYLVFVTAYIEYAIKGYEANAFRYLLKPLSLEMLRSVLVDIQTEYQKKKSISVKTKDGERLVLLRDLIYISAEDKYTVLYTKKQHYISDCSLKKYEEQLREYGFCRIHRKFLVNLYHHRGIKEGKVVLSDGCVLSSSKKRMSDYQERLFHYLGEDLI